MYSLSLLLPHLKGGRTEQQVTPMNSRKHHHVCNQKHATDQPSQGGQNLTIQCCCHAVQSPDPASLEPPSYQPIVAFARVQSRPYHPMIKPYYRSAYRPWPPLAWRVCAVKSPGSMRCTPLRPSFLRPPLQAPTQQAVAEAPHPGVHSCPTRTPTKQ